MSKCRFDGFRAGITDLDYFPNGEIAIRFHTAPAAFSNSHQAISVNVTKLPQITESSDSQVREKLSLGTNGADDI